MTLGAGPLNALYPTAESTDWEDARLVTGSTAICDGTVFRVAERFAFWLDGAKVWSPTMSAGAWHASLVRHNLATLTRDVRTRPARGGLQPLIPMVGQRAETFARCDAEATPLVHLAAPAIAALADWLTASLAGPSEPVPAPIAAVGALIGLGPGLTPSGDDFLGGVLVALRQLGASGIAGRLATAVLSGAWRGTHEISRAHLAAAAAGEGSESLHLLLSSLVTPGAPDMGACLSAIDAIGHTSGWDALAGVVLVAAIMARVAGVRALATASV